MNDGFCKSYCLGFMMAAVVTLTIIVLVMAGSLNRQGKRIDGQCREIDQLRSQVCDDWNKLNKRISELPKPTPPCACGPIPAACKCEPAKSCSCEKQGTSQCCPKPEVVPPTPAPAAPVKPETILTTPAKRSAPVRVCPPACKVRR